MNEKKIDKTIDFLLQQQAQFFADLEGLKEVQIAAEKRVNGIERACINLYNVSVEQNKATVEQGKNITKISEGIAKMQEETKDRFKETDDRLNAVIFMVEKFIGGNGKKRK